jgi:GTP-binding protein EngB required for normal cell division
LPKTSSEKQLVETRKWWNIWLAKALECVGSEREMEQLESRLIQERTDSERRVQEYLTKADKVIQQMKEDMEQARGRTQLLRRGNTRKQFEHCKQNESLQEKER